MYPQSFCSSLELRPGRLACAGRLQRPIPSETTISYSKVIVNMQRSVESWNYKGKILADDAKVYKKQCLIRGKWGDASASIRWNRGSRLAESPKHRLRAPLMSCIEPIEPLHPSLNVAGQSRPRNLGRNRAQARKDAPEAHRASDLYQSPNWKDIISIPKKMRTTK